jgi:hypothetical protein
MPGRLLRGQYLDRRRDSLHLNLQDGNSFVNDGRGSRRRNHLTALDADCGRRIGRRSHDGRNRESDGNRGTERNMASRRDNKGGEQDETQGKLPVGHDRISVKKVVEEQKGSRYAVGGAPPPSSRFRN